jgi:ubiquinone/menaquinone biosynthesis C-methylase UbiE
MDRTRGAQRHFARVAAVYDFVRNTDTDVVEEIVGRLPHRSGRLEIADVGCGTGRYSNVMAARLSGNLRMWCCDFNLAMLQECRQRMSGNYPGRPFRYSRVSANCLPFADGALDAIVSFNAVHHFDLERFVSESARVLRPGGLLAIYTRTPLQNARTIWGEHFPGFNHYENRLFPRERLERAIVSVPSLQLEDVREFTHYRIEPTDSLLHRARNFHYSTFSLYPPKEFTRALAEFAPRVSKLGNGTIEHTAENTLVLARRTENTDFRTDVSP